jgi:hypothetical protein
MLDPPLGVIVFPFSPIALQLGPAAVLGARRRRRAFRRGRAADRPHRPGRCARPARDRRAEAQFASARSTARRLGNEAVS